jgi:hypothetical protein
MAHIEVNADTIKFSQEYVDYKRHTRNVSYYAKFDGKEYPVIGDPNADAVSVRRASERKMTFILTKVGKLASRMEASVSGDRETITITYTDYSSGKPHNGSSVYDRQ